MWHEHVQYIQKKDYKQGLFTPVCGPFVCSSIKDVLLSKLHREQGTEKNIDLFTLLT